MSIDRNRGCTIRIHPQGFRVVMYKDAPGEFFSEGGEPFPAEVASAAGFDTEGLGRERLKQQRLAEMKEQIEREYASREEDMARVLSEESPTGLEVKHIGAGKYAVFNKNGERLTQEPMAKGQCQELLRQLDSESETTPATGEE